MARGSGGFRPPKNYDPYRGKRAKGRGRSGRKPGGSTSERNRKNAAQVAQAAPATPAASRPRPQRKPVAQAQEVRLWDAVATEEGRAFRAQQKPPVRQRKHTGAAEQKQEQCFERYDAVLFEQGEQPESFAQLGLGARICDELAKTGAHTPFPIQAATIPHGLRGKDLLGRAQTGSGKTIAFATIAVERLARSATQTEAHENTQGKLEENRKRGRRRVRALLLAPTRELAQQINRTAAPLARRLGMRTVEVVGGADISRQRTALRRGVDLVVGTVGRIEDLIERGDLRLNAIEIAVLDEADHMSELGFIEPVQRILRKTPTTAQILLFSATLDRQVQEIVDEFLKDPLVYEVADREKGRIDHSVRVVFREHKREALIELARPRTIMFARTRAYVETVTEMLREAGIKVVDLHGNLTQARREKNLRTFTRNEADVLVATDVAARGIHVDDVDLVVHADAADTAKTYLHRSGRTGRAGRTGTVITLIPPTSQKRMRTLLADAGVTVSEFAKHTPARILEQEAAKTDPANSEN